MHNTAHSFPLHFLLSLPGCSIINDKVKWIIRSRKGTAEWVYQYLFALTTFLLLHCSTKMLPKQQEGPAQVMMALVKAFDCVYLGGTSTCNCWMHTLSDFRASPWKACLFLVKAKFPPCRCIFDHFMKVSSGILLQDGRDHIQGKPGYKASY